MNDSQWLLKSTHGRRDLQAGALAGEMSTEAKMSLCKHAGRRGREGKISTRKKKLTFRDRSRNKGAINRLLIGVFGKCSKSYSAIHYLEKMVMVVADREWMVDVKRMDDREVEAEEDYSFCSWIRLRTKI